MLKYIRGFHWASKAWYSRFEEIKSKDIIFGLYDSVGGTLGEMIMAWHDVNGNLAPRLEVFDDAWKVLYNFQDVLSELAKVDGNAITEEEFIEILKKCGFKDMTQYEREYVPAL